MSRFQNIVWPCFTLFMFAVALFFNYTASTGLVSDLDVGEVSDEYPLEITPAGWTFSIWGFIYIWQAVWIVFTLILTCKYDMDRIFFGKWFWAAYNAANACNAIWLVIWVNELVIPAAISLVCITIGLITAAYLAHKYLFAASFQVGADPSYQEATTPSYGGVDSTVQQADSEAFPKWLTGSRTIRLWLYATVCNGIPFYATWCVVASHLNVGIALCHKTGLGLSETATSFLMLSILTCVILTYWYCDFVRFRMQLRYTYSPYAVLIVAFLGVLTNGGLDTEERPSSAFTLALLILAGLGTVAKVVMGVLMRNMPTQTLQSV